MEARRSVVEKTCNISSGIVLNAQTKPYKPMSRYSRYIPIPNDSVNIKSVKTVSFNGSVDKILSSLGKSAKNPLAPLFVSSLGALLFRVPIIASDKKTSKEERTYAATWLGVMSLIGLGVQLAINKPIAKLSNNFAKSLLNIKNPITPKEIARVTGASKVFEFLSWVVALNAVNIVIARYLKRGMNFINEKFKGKAPKPEAKEQLPQEEKIKRKKIDKVILGSLSAAAGFIGLNFIGRKFNYGPIATDTMTKIAKQLNKSLNITENVKNLWTKTKDSINRLSQTNKLFKDIKKAAAWPRSEKGMDWFAKQGNASDKWLDRAILSNMIIRPLILLPTGQYYTVVSSIVNEALAFLSLKTVGNFLVKKASPKLITALKVSANNNAAKAGVEAIVDQGIKNIGLVCIGMGFLNNIVSRNMLKMLKNNTEEKTDNNIFKPAETNLSATYANKTNTAISETSKDMDNWLKNIKNNSQTNAFSAVK